MPTALGHLRICDFTGQLAGAGATKWLAAFGAEVIRIEDPVTMGLWDILRPMPPFVDERRGPDFGGGFNNHNVEKLGITLNLRTERAREILAEIVKRSDVVSERPASVQAMSTHWPSPVRWRWRSASRIAIAMYMPPVWSMYE